MANSQSQSSPTFSGKYAEHDPFDFVNQMLDLIPDTRVRCCELRKIATREGWLMNSFQLPEGNFLHRYPKAVRQEALRRMKALNALSCKSCVECAQFEK